ncbi:hypothetical protein ACFY1A_24940 [Streptomyces sp. NPDC001520]|uniref:hypothetical protein n=1 Tax=Streptomyces sp. NPDC001520 TaxID=3364581 RepID=UPI0036C4450A
MQPTRPNGTEVLTDDGRQGVQAELEHDPLETARTHVSALLHHARMLTGEPGDVLDMALRTAQRAFAEIDACNTLLDRASERAHALARELEGRLAEGDSAAAPGLLDELDALAARVAASEAERQVVLRILGMQDAEAGDARTPADDRDPVPRLTAAKLPRVPSLYDAEQPGYGTLTDMMAARERTAAQRAAAHARRSAVVTKHMTEIVMRLANVSLSDPALNEEALAELRHAYALWLVCADERRDDS